MVRFRLTALLFLLPFLSFSQTNTTDTVYHWTVKSELIGEGKYNLIFTSPGHSNWYLYDATESLEGVALNTVSFEDSSFVPVSQLSVTTQGTVSEIANPIFDGKKMKMVQGPVVWKMTVQLPQPAPAQLNGTLNYSYGKDEEFYPQTIAFTVPLEGGISTAKKIKVASLDIKNAVNPCGDDDGGEKKSLVTIFFLGLLGGLIALLTPCVFPMIPVTVTFFTKKSGEKSKGVTNAILYGLFIFLIYILITVPFHVANEAISPEIFNNISTNVWVNLVFFAVFVAFALSFFGLYEIGLPASFANTMDSKSGLGNLGGIFFMAMTLAIVSFSCTGPILGTLLVGVAEQGAWPLTVGAAGFGLALGLPFALFAMFPHWLQSLPKSGGWMTDVKVVLGFVELALAVKFLSNADLVKQWGFLKRELFIALWIIIGICIVLYLLGKLKIGHSKPVTNFSIARIFFIILFGGFTLYLIPGLTNTKYADLKMISGFPPPRSYSYYHTADAGDQKLFEPLHNEYEKALQLAAEQNKPVLIDFTGWACVNCRRMEEKVWPDPTVDSLMRNEFIVVSLYVDEKNKLPLTEQTTDTLSNGTVKSIISVGDKWATFQTENFGATSQPQYAIISADQKALTKTKYYTPEASEFIEWLECGLDAHRKMK